MRISTRLHCLSKEQLRRVYLKKRIEEIARNSHLSYNNMKKNLESLIHMSKQRRIDTIGSYIFLSGKEIIPPYLQSYKRAFPFFQPRDGYNIAPLISNYTKQVYGIKIPERSLPTVYPEMVLVPLMCFNAYSKQRLGYGGGYYDQYILHCRQQKTNTVFVGIGFECLKQPTDFSSQNDQPLDYVITQKTIY